jgi:hypothetical protein
MLRTRLINGGLFHVSSDDSPRSGPIGCSIHAANKLAFGRRHIENRPDAQRNRQASGTNSPPLVRTQLANRYFPFRQNLTHSTATTYASDTPSVAAVDGMGLVTAVSTGSATIIINGAFRIPVTVLRPGSEYLLSVSLRRIRERT